MSKMSQENFQNTVGLFCFRYFGTFLSQQNGPNYFDTTCKICYNEKLFETSQFIMTSALSSTSEIYFF